MSPDLRVPTEPAPVPLTDAELATVESEIALLIAAKTSEANEKLFALQARVIASPAETLRGCVSKLRVIFDPDNGPCAAAIEDRELAAVAQVVNVIDRAIAPDAAGEVEIPTATLAHATDAVRRLLDPAMGIEAMLDDREYFNYHTYRLSLDLVGQIVERAIERASGNVEPPAARAEDGGDVAAETPEASARVKFEPLKAGGDAALVDAAQKLNRMIEKFEALPPLADGDATDERMQDEHERWFAIKRFIADTPAQGLTGCLVKLRELVLSLHGPIDIGDSDTRDIEAFREMVEVIERINAPPAIGADAAVIAAGREADRLNAEIEVEDDDDARMEMIPKAQEAAGTVMTTPINTLAGAACVVRCLIAPVTGIDTILKDHEYRTYLTGLNHVLAVIERMAATPADDTDSALLDAEREFYASIATTEQWSTDNPDKSLEDNPEWVRCQELYDHALALVPTSAAGAVSILRVMLCPDWGARETAPGNIGEILARVLRGFVGDFTRASEAAKGGAS